MICDAVLFFGLSFLYNSCGISFEKKHLLIGLYSYESKVESLDKLSKINAPCSLIDERKGKTWIKYQYECRLPEFDLSLMFYNDKLYMVAIDNIKKLKSVYELPCCGFIGQLNLQRYSYKTTAENLVVTHGFENGLDFISISDYWFSQTISYEMERDPEFEK